MNCLNHEDREAIGMCVRCHKLICEECKVKINIIVKSVFLKYILIII